MNTLKSKSNIQEEADRGRRSFIWKVGAGMSAVLAAAVPGMAKTRSGNDTGLKRKVNGLSKQVVMLEDQSTIHSLHRTYESLLDSGSYKEAVSLFTDDAEVIFNGGVFKGRNNGIRRLYEEQFSYGLTGKRIDQAPGFELNTTQQEDVLEVSGDGKTAKAQFKYSIQVGAPIVSDSSLVKMARLQGEGIMKWWEGGTYEVSYIKNIKNGSWKIKKLEYNVLSRADYRSGKSFAKPIDISLFSKTYPEDPAGPDRLVKKG
ncbi:nuclear transport factor 2 family protein [Thermodesulfobacteriota bacterium]